MGKLGTFVKVCLLVALAIMLLIREESLFSLVQEKGHESVLKLGLTQSSTTASVQTTGGPDLHPENLEGKCVAVRFRNSATLSVDEAIKYMKAEKRNNRGITSKPLSVGLVFMDKPGDFISLGKGGSGSDKVFHLFHFLEFLIVSYKEMHRLTSAGDDKPTRSSSSSSSSTTSLSRGSPPIRISWIYTPMLYKSEICGVAGGINCLISDLILQASSSSSSSSWKTQFYGLESNDQYTRSMHPNFKGEHDRRNNGSPLNLPQQLYNNQDYERMQQEADAVFIVSRKECDPRGINKMWADYIDGFPADKWHTDVLAGLEKSADRQVATQPNTDKIVVGYVDRQNTRRTMPEREHEWLVGFLTDHPMIEFLHLHMEDYTSLEQIRMASECHVLIGVHGNGLSHVLWMQPERYVVELFWQFPFQFDYLTSAQLMRHNYLGLFNGKAIDEELIRTRDKSLRLMPKKISVTEQNFTKYMDEVEEGRQALMAFLHKAMIEFGVR